MLPVDSQAVWQNHYHKPNSNLLIPDENVVRYFSGKPSQTDNHPTRILDIGTGSGRHGIWLMQNGFDVTFHDFAPRALEHVKENLKSNQITVPDADKLLCGSADSIDLAEASFDAILAWGVLHYNSPEKQKSIIAEMSRLLTPNGYLFLTIRANSETDLQTSAQAAHKINAGDLKGADLFPVNLEELNQLFANFNDVKIGYMERSRLGDLSKRICHYIVAAQK